MKKSFIRVNHLSDVAERRPTYLAIGSFDGVHLGHQAVLKKMVTAAQRDGVRTAVLTFFPHPKRVIQELTGPYYLMTLSDRVEMLAAQGIDLIITHPFNDEVRTTRAADFVDQLCHHLNMRQLWGGNFALGYKREGDVPTLRRLGETRGFTVELVDAMVVVDGDQVSSSRIRQSLQAGDIEDANRCLGRPYRVCGPVTMGDKRGRTIGFPTANVQHWPEQLLPANGVYATRVRLGDESFVAATNVGVRPTVDGHKLIVEAHLLDFKRDIYDREICVEFVRRIRPEMKFAGLDELKAQIATDVTAVRQSF